MDSIKHTFPLPETAAHQLEEIEYELQHRPVYEKMKDFLRIHRWKMLALAGISGLVFGVCLASRHQ